MTPCDSDLLRQYAEIRDESAFAEIVRRHVDLVYATALRSLNGDAHLAEDVTQKAFTDLARHAATLGEGAALAGWLHTSARFHASKTVRKEQRRRAREQESTAMHDQDPAADLFWEQLRPLLDEAVGELADADREAVLLRFFEGRSHREVAAALNVTEDAARMRVERALDRMRLQFSRRGLKSTAALLGTALAAYGATPAPAAFAATVAAKSISAAAIAGAGWWAWFPLKTHAGRIMTASVATIAVLLLWQKQPTRADTGPAALATNQLGLELFRQVAAGTPGGNVLLSPFSIQSTLAMTYVGAAGDTRAEMARVLHFPSDDAALAASFGALRAALDATAKKSVAITAGGPRADGNQSALAGPRLQNLEGKTDPIEWHAANRLYGQTGYEFRSSFLAFVKDSYGTPLELVNFKTAAEPARIKINSWVGEQTHKKIPNLIPVGGIDDLSRLVLVNALYLKAPWETGMAFDEYATSGRPFQLSIGESVIVPTMEQKAGFGYSKFVGYTAVSLPYLGGELQFLILLPDDPAGVDALAAQITPALLKECATLERPEQQVELFLPKFRLEPATIPLKDELIALGMNTAFDQPRGSANFDRMASRRPDEYLLISEVFHTAFLALDEEGTEAAAATAVVMAVGGGHGPPRGPQPIIVQVDHPFLFAIQHRESGTCLFLGKITDPR